MLNVLAQIVCLETLSVDLALSFILTSFQVLCFPLDYSHYASFRLSIDVGT